MKAQRVWEIIAGSLMVLFVISCVAGCIAQMSFKGLVVFLVAGAGLVYLLHRELS